MTSIQLNVLSALSGLWNDLNVQNELYLLCKGHAATPSNFESNPGFVSNVTF